MHPLRHALTLAIVALAGAPLHAQVAPPASGWIIEDELRYRDQQGRRDAAAPMGEARGWITVDSVRRASSGGRRLFVHFGAAELATMFRSRVPAQLALARSALPALVRDSATLADSATAARLAGRLLAATLEGTAPWPTLGDTAGTQRRTGPILHARAGNVYVLGDSIAASVRATLAARARVVTSAEWERVPLREAAVLYRVGPVRRVGPFVELSITASERLARTADQAPALYASWARYVLMQVDGERVVVWQSVAVT